MATDAMATRLSTINDNFLQGLLDVDKLSSISLDNFDLTTSDVLAAVRGHVAADITAAKFPAAKMKDDSRQVLNLGDHIGKLASAGAFNNNTTLTDLANKYATLFSACIKGTEGNWASCPLMRSVTFKHPEQSDFAAPLISRPNGTTTYVNGDNADADDGRAKTRLSRVVNTYTFKRVAIYAVLCLNAMVLAYDMIAIALDSSSTENVTLKSMFKFTMNQFEKLNSIYVPRPDMAEAWESAVPSTTVLDCSGCSTPANRYGMNSWGATAKPLVASASSLGANAFNAFKSSGWTTAPSGVVSASTWGGKLPFDLTNLDRIVVSTVGTDAFKVTVDVDSVGNDLSTVTANGTAKTLQYTKGTNGNNVYEAVVGTGGGPFNVIQVSEVAKSLTTFSNIGFRLSFPVAPAPSVAISTMPSASKYKHVWAGAEDRLFPATGAVGASAVGWRVPTTSATPAAPPVAAGSTTIAGGPFWAAAPNNDTATNGDIELASYTVAPPLPGYFDAPAGWDVYVSTTPLVAAMTPSSFAWKFAQTDTKPAVFPASGARFDLKAPVKFTAILLAPFGGSAASRTSPEGTGFGSVALDVRSVTSTEPGKDLTVLGTMKTHEANFQKDVRALNDQTHEVRRSQADLARASTTARSASAAAKRARTVAWAYLAILLVTVGATVAALLAHGQGGGRRGAATPLLAGLALLAAAAYAALQFAGP